MKIAFPSRLIFSLFAGVSLLALSCGGIGLRAGTGGEPAEFFEIANRPLFQPFLADNDADGITDEDYYLCEPWNYRKEANSDRRYPLFIYLHGQGSSGEPGILPCLQDGAAFDAQRQSYPSFVYIPHGFSADTIINRIGELRTQYRIDDNRIYVVGYSQGASGSYSLANGYFDRTGRLFAGIIRQSGQSQTTLRDAIARKTSVWYHIGLLDTDGRPAIAAACYDFLKNYSTNATAVETTVPVPEVVNREGTTKILTKNGMEIVRYTEYPQEGHGISHFPFLDPYMLEWLFSQSLTKR